MIATGTDVKPLECLLFMRNIRSLGYFEQMKGRGCRVVDPDVLQSVTPDARHKTHFVIVDAVGVCEDEKTATKPLDRKPSVPLDKMLNLVAAGAADADLVSTLAARLARLDREVDPIQQAAIAEGVGRQVARRPRRRAAQEHRPRREHAAGRREVQASRTARSRPRSRSPRSSRSRWRRRSSRSTTRSCGTRSWRRSGRWSRSSTSRRPTSSSGPASTPTALEKAKSMLTSFRQFIEDNKDEIEALQVLYSRPYRAGLRFRHVKELAAKLNQPPFFVDPNRPESLTGCGRRSRWSSRTRCGARAASNWWT